MSLQAITFISVAPYCLDSQRGILVYVEAISEEADAHRWQIMPDSCYVVNSMAESVRIFDIYWIAWDSSG